MKLFKLIASLYFITLVSLFFYSFTQVDLSLTLTQASIFKDIISTLQYLGFFQRELSAIIFALISFLLFLFYFLFLNQSKKISGKMLFSLICGIFFILVLSYNAFSYDLFNYIFDAKILTFYHQNPYLFKPLDFIGDPMLTFMRWTHRVYPYGPSWLALTVPLSFIGSNIFLVTFFLFKLMIGLSFLGSAFLIYKISELVSPENKIFNTLFFALNPLVLIEGLVSAHNDFPLVFFALLSFYLFIRKKKVFSFVSLAFSIGIKYLSFILLPIFGYLMILENKKIKINWDKIFLLSLALSLVTLALVTFRTNFQPWYLIFPMSLAAFNAKRPYVFLPVIVASLSMIAVYYFYVLLTDYAPNYPAVITRVETLALFAVIVSFIIGFLFKKRLFKLLNNS
ncbi:MAG: hypothetical protein A2798_01815 [Candidatus Levybacteria bacterium RIFCSPHIGHO2_01_FULL_37_17]|nr:MAG: hypothetical protein A2798_01815 [Candidatus Levybacteria bacterium RIFCSPHIGHO2_01_FULL_37_17]OGH37184.1 MAG: hypothetical protein A2959_02675 [Candidatus Levybacteria bacterium RIFCSPLOWO2_01_FULL_38_23]